MSLTSVMCPTCKGSGTLGQQDDKAHLDCGGTGAKPDGSMLRHAIKNMVRLDATHHLQMIEENARLRMELEAIDRLAEAGLCYFTLGSAREFLKDIRNKVMASLEVGA